MNEWHFLWSSLCPTQRQLSSDFLKYSFLMSFIVSLSRFPPFILLWLSFFFILNSESWLLLTLITHLCYFCSCAFKIQLFSFWDSFFFFFREHFFFEGPLLMQFPVILLALSLNLNWLRWSSLGIVPRPSLPKPVCDINGPCTGSSSLWILLAGGRPLMLPFIILCCGQTVRVNCLWQAVNQHEKQKGWGARW